MGENTSLTISFSMLKILKIIFPNFIYENDEAQELPSYPFQEIKLVRFEQNFNFYTHFTATSFKIQAYIFVWFLYAISSHHLVSVWISKKTYVSLDYFSSGQTSLNFREKITTLYTVIHFYYLWISPFLD